MHGVGAAIASPMCDRIDFVSAAGTIREECVLLLFLFEQITISTT